MTIPGDITVPLVEWFQNKTKAKQTQGIRDFKGASGTKERLGASARKKNEVGRGQVESRRHSVTSSVAGES